MEYPALARYLTRSFSRLARKTAPPCSASTGTPPRRLLYPATTTTTTNTLTGTVTAGLLPTAGNTFRRDLSGMCCRCRSQVKEEPSVAAGSSVEKAPETDTTPAERAQTMPAEKRQTAPVVKPLGESTYEDGSIGIRRVRFGDYDSRLG